MNESSAVFSKFEAKVDIPFYRITAFLSALSFILCAGCTSSHEKTPQNDFNGGRSDSSIVIDDSGYLADSADRANGEYDRDGSISGFDSGVVPDSQAALCGNQVIDPGEECDFPSMNGQTCESLGLGKGDVGCRECRFMTDACSANQPDPVPFESWKPNQEEGFESKWSDEPGWRNSEEYFCSSNREVSSGMSTEKTSSGVWSDESGVYVLVYPGREPSTDVAGSDIFYNDGTGWQDYFWLNYFEPGYMKLAGFSNESIVVYGDIPCEVQIIENGESADCLSTVPAMNDMFPVNSSLAYGVYDDRVLKFDGIEWSEFAAPPEITASSSVVGPSLKRIWANETTVVAAASDTIYIKRDAAQFEKHQVYNSGPIWGFSADDIWTALGWELLHFDGSTWDVIWTGDDECDSILNIWGADGVVFFHSSKKLGMWDGSRIEILADFVCGGPSANAWIKSIWGNSASELFVLIRGRNIIGNGCGSYFMFWYDGTQLRRF